MPQFTEPFETTTMIAWTERRVIIAPSLLNLWWGAGAGPQSAAGLVDVHSDAIEELVAVMIVEGVVDPDASVAITLGEDEWEGAAPADDVDAGGELTPMPDEPDWAD